MSGTLPSELRRFAMLRNDVEAVLQRSGHQTYDLVLVDSEGEWTRWVFGSADLARDAAARLAVPLHEGWDARMEKRMNKHDDWSEPGGHHRAL